MEHTDSQKSKVHKVLAHSYLTYFILFLVGIVLDFIFKFQFFTNSITIFIGFISLLFATFLIFWAQKTSRNLDMENMSKDTFCKGPYCYTRSPTHWGLFFLMLGFGVIANAVFVILFGLIAFLVTRFVFLSKQESLLAEKYGAPYLEYQKAVNL